MLYIIRTGSASAYGHRREVERPHGHPMDMHEKRMRAIGNVAILGGTPRLLVFDRTGSQILPTFTLETVR